MGRFYSESHREFVESTGLKIGDMVIVYRHHKSSDYEDYDWPSDWVDSMNSMVGKIWPIYMMSDADGFILKYLGRRFYFPWYVLIPASDGLSWDTFIVMHPYLNGVYVSDKSRKLLLKLYKILAGMKEDEMMQVLRIIESREATNDEICF